MTDRPCLIVRRLADLETHQCARCGEDVALFPAGQEAKRRMPSLELVCSVCQPVAAGDVGLTVRPWPR